MAPGGYLIQAGTSREVDELCGCGISHPYWCMPSR
jgi:hypothetical protein